MQSNSVPKISKIKNLFISDLQTLTPNKLKEANIPKKSLAQYKAEMSPSKNFWMGTAFGRTLTGRNKTGKVVRRVGGTALAVGLGLLGVPDAVTDVINPSSGGSDILAILAHIETILILIGAILSGIGIGSDQMEVFQERLDEREIASDESDPLIRRLTHKIKGG